jgi:septal ring factor EnvC (AmiA/AmiB activator)
MSIEQVVNAVDTAIHKLPHIENLYHQAKDQTEKMQRTIQRLVNDMRSLEHKISILDKTVFSCEQDCKRTEQRVQEFSDKRIEQKSHKVSIIVKAILLIDKSVVVIIVKLL